MHADMYQTLRGVLQDFLKMVQLNIEENEPKEDDPSIHEVSLCIKDIRALEQQYFPKERINFFDAIGFSNQEIRHSRLLAFLLNPNNNHFLGDAFIKEILLRIATINSEIITRNEALRYITGEFDDARVITEWHHIDIYFESKQNKIIVAIENKIKAKEHGNQLENYKDLIVKRSKSISRGNDDYKIILLYLTPDETLARNSLSWFSISYELILDSLKSARVANNIPKNSDAWRLIEEYIRLIEKEVVVNIELKEALQEIYQKHKTVFDLVLEARDEDDGSFEEEIRAKLIHKLSVSGIKIRETSAHQWGYMKGYGFIPEDWLSFVPDELESTWWRHKKPATWFIKTYYKDDKASKLELWLDFKGDWVGDNAERIDLIEDIRKHFPVTSRNKGRQSKGGVVLQSILIQDNGNEEESIAEKLSDYIRNNLRSIEDKLRNFFSGSEAAEID